MFVSSLLLAFKYAPIYWKQIYTLSALRSCAACPDPIGLCGSFVRVFYTEQNELDDFLDRDDSKWLVCKQNDTKYAQLSLI